jgi:spore maturation protein CgeB
MVDNAEQINYWLTHDEEREQIARAGRDRIFERFTIERMLTEILEPVKYGKRPGAALAARRIS